MTPTVGVARCEWVPATVEAAVSRCMRERFAFLAVHGGSAIEEAARAERLAALHEREARWWEVLERWLMAHPGQLPNVFRRAVTHAVHAQSQAARRWRSLAADWRRLADGLPVCLVIGCECGGSGVCGVAS